MRPSLLLIESLLVFAFVYTSLIDDVEANRLKSGSNSFENEMLHSNPRNRSYSRQTSDQQRAVIHNKWTHKENPK